MGSSRNDIFCLYIPIFSAAIGAMEQSFHIAPERGAMEKNLAAAPEAMKQPKEDPRTILVDAFSRLKTLNDQAKA